MAVTSISHNRRSKRHGESERKKEKQTTSRKEPGTKKQLK